MDIDKEKILFWIYHHGGSATVSQVQRHMQRLNRDERARLIDSLVDDGYIERETLYRTTPGKLAQLLVMRSKGERHIERLRRKGAIQGEPARADL